jgi:hypothetical protein
MGGIGISVERCNNQPAELCACGVAIMQWVTNKLGDKVTVIAFHSIAPSFHKISRDSNIYTVWR